MKDWYITDDKKAVQLEVQKVECPKCHHYELYEPFKAKAILDDWKNFKCPLCWTPKGVVKHVAAYSQCGLCNQVFDKDRSCYCPVKEDSGLKIITDPKHIWTKKNPITKEIDRLIEDGKTQRLLKQKVDKAKLEPLENSKKTVELLEKLVQLMTPKVEKVETKEVNHTAIQ